MGGLLYSYAGKGDSLRLLVVPASINSSLQSFADIVSKVSEDFYTVGILDFLWHCEIFLVVRTISYVSYCCLLLS